MSLKLGYRKMGIPKSDWEQLDRMHTETAEGRYGYRKLVNLKTDPPPALKGAPQVPEQERREAPQIGQVNASIARKKIRDNEIGPGEALGQELSRGSGPRPMVLMEIRMIAEATNNIDVLQLLDQLAQEEDASRHGDGGDTTAGV